jgi:glycosyltransferase involved in cell wall biosynthesis
MGIASAILVLIFSTIYRWINSRAERAGYPPMNRAIYYLIMLSIVFYCIAIESIDGAGEGPLHTPSAIIFFVVQEIAIVYITLYLYELREWDSSIISLKSMRLKALLAIYVSLVWIYCLYGTYGQSENSLDYSVIVEWNAVFVTLLWCLSFSLEWKDIKLSLVTSQKEALLMS